MRQGAGGLFACVETAVAEKARGDAGPGLDHMAIGVALGDPVVRQSVQQVDRGGATVGEAGDHRGSRMAIEIAGYEAGVTVVTADAVGIVEQTVLIF